LLDLTRLAWMDQARMVEQYGKVPELSESESTITLLTARSLIIQKNVREDELE